jgi:hypothetical protein
MHEKKEKDLRTAYILDRHGNPTGMTAEWRAYDFLNCGRAKGHLTIPLVIRMVALDSKDINVPKYVLKIDPGSKTTGFAVVEIMSPEGSKTAVDPSGPLNASPEAKGPPEPAKASDESLRPAWDKPQRVVALYELEHRGDSIHQAMIARAQARGRRRSANLPYRPPRFDNRGRDEGWLPPSVKHRVDSLLAVVKKIFSWLPIAAIIIEDCKFDIHALLNPDISGDEYQRGPLYKRHVMEYLLELWDRRCAYCGATGVPLEMDHVIPASKNGSNSVSNLTIACRSCNQRKSNRDLDEFLADDPERLEAIKAKLKAPLRDATVMNILRHVIRERLEKELGVPVYGAYAAETKYNRERFGVPKFHAGDAACAGQMGSLEGWNKPILVLKSMGRGQRRREQSDKFGLPRNPRSLLSGSKMHHGFATGDIVRGIVTKGKYKGTHVGRVIAQSNGQFYIKKDIVTIKDGVELKERVRLSFSAKNTKLIQRGDGYAYSTRMPPTIDED